MTDAAMMKNFYDECSDMRDKRKKESNKKSIVLMILDNIYYTIQFRQIAKELKIENHFERNKDVCGGHVVIKNTRIRPEIINDYMLSNLEKDRDFDKVLKKVKTNYPALSDENILCSLLYCIKGIKVKVK